MVTCKMCDKELGYFAQEGVRVWDVDCRHVGVYCEEHAVETETALKEERFVEEYKNHQIYTKDGVYFPYWRCPYFFTDLEGARSRIDAPHIAVIDKNAFKYLGGR